ncbi:helix-turn-helix domain-containing protein [Silvibacterium acidisoli]|uniref:helix-turn-helix domain-containing protein n=1 Tax=Acidobacteriaceae bacterium ZG23-2 TaxID=2883246 RepID=UPI00406CDD3F
MSLSRDIYPNLKLRIYTTGIRQNRLARMLGIDEAHLSRIINGFRQPSGDIRAQLANILQSDPEWLFHRLQISDDRLAADGMLSGEIAKPQFTTR